MGGLCAGCHLRALDDGAADWVAVAETIASPYKWGSRSIFGLDCSALVQLALAAGGVRVPRDFGPQLTSGQKIAGLGNLQQGGNGVILYSGAGMLVMLDPDGTLHANAYHGGGGRTLRQLTELQRWRGRSPPGGGGGVMIT